MRVGIVNPYSWDVPGGVQFHIRDFALELHARGHEVSVLTPSTASDLPDWIVPVGSSLPIPFNGSIARLSFTPAAAARTRRWLEEGNFDILHVHEPGVPSISMMALKAATIPTVATFHAALDRSIARAVTSGPLDPLLEKLAARIAVSAEARRTLVEHHGGDALIIPNGVETGAFRRAQPLPQWAATPERPVIVFLGRVDEPRKGLPVFARAVPDVLQEIPGARFLIAGRGQAPHIRQSLEVYGDCVEFLGEITDEEKASLLAGASIYVAPQTGGESFGIVLVEAMAAGCAVVASDLEAFRAVLNGGEAGALFANENAEELAHTLLKLLRDPDRLTAIAQAGRAASAQYDWGTVTDQVCAVYSTVLSAVSGHSDRTPLELLRGERMQA